MNLMRLVYYSERNPAVALDVRELIQVCHRNNSKKNITGLLHYNGDHFLQVLEGGRADCSAIYHRIAQDTRHINIIMMQATPARERLFPTWSMGLHEGMDDRTSAIFLRYFSSDRIDPENVDVDVMLDALQDIAVEL